MAERWCRLEDYAAKVLGGERIFRDFTLFESAPDFVVKDFRVIGDCKAYKRFAHHKLLDECRRKYCEPCHIPLLATQHEGQRGAFVTLPIESLGELLNEIRRARTSITRERSA